MLLGDKYKDPDRQRAFVADLERRLATAPGVESAGIAQFLPLSSWYSVAEVWPDGTPKPPANEGFEIHLRLTSPGWYSAVRSPLVAGRTFTAADGPKDAPIAIVNESLARRLWPGAAPADVIGRRLKTDADLKDQVTAEVVGVIRDTRQLDPATPPAPELQRPFAQVPLNQVGIAARGQSPGAVLAAIRQEVRAIDADRPVSYAMSYEEMASDIIAPRTVAATLVGLLAGIAIALAALGIYGLLSYAVVLRTREIGVRVALGADAGSVVRLFLSGGLRLAVIGLGLGLAGALALSRVLGSVLYGVSPHDPATLAAVGSLLLAVALAASFFPARRAARLPPMTALRS
jgi:putative ABC transport system permease protein